MEDEIDQGGFGSFFKYHWRGFFHALSLIILLPFSFKSPIKENCVVFLHQLMFLWYAAEILPPGVTAVLPIIFLPLYGVVGSDILYNVYGMDCVWSFLLSYFVAIAIEQTRTSELMACCWISRFSLKPRVLLVSVMITTWILGTVLPQTVVCSLMLPLSKSIIQVLESISIGHLFDENYKIKNSKRPYPTSLSIAFGLGVAFSANIGSMATLCGSDVGEKLYDEFNRLLPNSTGPITYLTYLSMGLPLSALLFVCTIFYLQILYMGLLQSYSSNNILYDPEAAKNIFKDIISELPRPGAHNIITLAAWLALVLLCIFLRPIYMKGIVDIFGERIIQYSTVGTLVCLVLFLLPNTFDFCNYFRCNRPSAYKAASSILSWNAVQKHMSWSYFLVYGSSMALALGMKKSHYHIRIAFHNGTDKFSLEKTYYVFEAALLSIMGENHFVAESLINGAVRKCLLTNRHPGNLLYPIALGSNLSFLLPVSSVSNCFACAWFYIRAKSVILASLGPTICGILLAMLTVSTILPIVHPEYNFPPYPKK